MGLGGLLGTVRILTTNPLSFDLVNYFNIVHLHFDFTFNEKPV